nr:MAG TPA_asm: hypothetical protein [Caudoviricetes sp.]
MYLKHCTNWYIPSVLYTVERVIGYMWVQSPLPVHSPILVI